MISGIGRRKANRAEIDASITSPTKILPKRRNENEIIFVNSDTSSKSPMNKLNGLSEIYRVIYSLIPRVRILIECVAIMDTNASASVTFKSVDALRITGTNVLPWKNPTFVTIGISPLQLDRRINKKKLMKYGNIFFVRSAATDSVKL